MIPILYAPDATEFNSLGLGALSECTKCQVVEERNGAFELKLQYPVTGRHYSDIAYSCIIKAKPGDARSDQLFRIYKITNPVGGICTVYAEHISYQLNHIAVLPFSASSVTEVFSRMMSSRYLVGTNPFTMSSDITSTAVYTQTDPESIRARLGGQTGSVLDVYGGEFEWNNYRVVLHQQRGVQRDTTLLYGKNITDIEQEQNIESTYTEILPFWHGTVLVSDKESIQEEIDALEEQIEYLGTNIRSQSLLVNSRKAIYNNLVKTHPKQKKKIAEAKNDYKAAEAELGQMQNSLVSADAKLAELQTQLESTSEEEQEVLMYLPELTLEVDNADDFPYRRLKIVDFSQKFKEQPSVGDLRAAATAHMNANGFGEPVVSIKVSFIDLWNTEEYKDIAPLERVQLCDTIYVRFDKLNVNVTAKVIKTDYDVLLERYNSITVGNARSNLASTIVSGQDATDRAIEELPDSTHMDLAIENATNLITGGYGGYIVYSYNADGTPDEMLILNKPSVADATTVIRLNKNGIGFSRTGIEGPYTTAWTIDGHFVADFIDSGTLNADVIRAGTIRSLNDKNTYWNLDTGKMYLNNVNIVANSFSLTGGITIEDIADDAAAAARKAAEAYADAAAARAESNAKSYAFAQIGSIDTAVTNAKILAAMTGNYQTQGLWVWNKKFYMNAECLAAGTILGREFLSSSTGQSVFINAKQIQFYTSESTASSKVTAGGIYASYDSSGRRLFVGHAGTDSSLYLWGNTVYIRGIGDVKLQSTSGNITSSTIYGKDLSGSPNVRINAKGVLGVGSSARRFKFDIKRIGENEELDYHKILDIPVVQFKFKPECDDPSNENYLKDVPGFIADEVEEVYPIAAIHRNGIIQDWDERYIIPPMLALIQEQHKKIEELEKTIADYEQRFSDIEKRLAKLEGGT